MNATRLMFGAAMVALLLASGLETSHKHHSEASSSVAEIPPPPAVTLEQTVAQWATEVPEGGRLVVLETNQAEIDAARQATGVVKPTCGCSGHLSCFSYFRGLIHGMLGRSNIAGNVVGTVVFGTTMFVGVVISHGLLAPHAASLTLFGPHAVWVPFQSGAVYASFDRAAVAGIIAQQWTRRQWNRDQTLLDGEEYPSNVLTLGNAELLRADDQLGCCMAPVRECLAGCLGAAPSCCSGNMPNFLGKPNVEQMKKGIQGADNCWSACGRGLGLLTFANFRKKSKATRSDREDRFAELRQQLADQ